MMELRGIAVRPERNKPVEALERAVISARDGISGDHRSRPGSRQVTVLSEDSWHQACAELGVALPWLARRANLLVGGLVFEPGCVGDILKMGDVELLITGETDPCAKMEAAHSGLRKALEPQWRGGVTCRVVTGGEVQVGEPVAVIRQTR